MNPLQTEATEYTPKMCPYCHRWYVSPKGSRQPGCRRCCPMIGDELPDEEYTTRRHIYSIETGSDEIPF